MNNKILENESIKYRVVLDNRVLAERTSELLAEQFVATLTPEQQSNVNIIPITEGGKQVLLG
tara:strand:+ start:224 stop:409 length:186 start_codon:yes stop_codon:yes gene_type:complete